jgi:putative copper resistance protein D
VTGLLATARAVHFASLMAIFGGSIYALLLRYAGIGGSPAKGTRVLYATAATLAIASGVVWFCLVAGQMSGSWQGSIDPGTIELAAIGTRFGHVFVVRFIGLAGLWIFCAAGDRSDSAACSILAGLLLASLGLISHAAAIDDDIVSIGAISDAAHLLTSGYWLGGLMILAILLQRHSEDRAFLTGSLRVFSTWGTLAVAVLVVTGLANAISILPLNEMSLGNSYFDLLLVKVALASIMIGLAILNRWRFAPALRNDADGAVQRLRASVGGEFVLGLAILAIVGLLGVMPPH